MVQDAMLRRRIETEFGWSLQISHAPNKRSLFNFPMQGNGAEMLRLATMRLCDAGIVPVMLIHDGILFAETDAEKIGHAREIMLQAGRDCCNGLTVGVDGADRDQLFKNGARFRDKRPMAKKMWSTIMDTLKAVGALPEKDVA